MSKHKHIPASDEAWELSELGNDPKFAKIFETSSRSCLALVAWVGRHKADPRHGYPGAVTVPVTDSALTPRSTTPNRRVGFPARAFW